MSLPVHICGRNGIYIPGTQGNSSLTVFRGSYQGEGTSVTTVTIELDGYEYSLGDVAFVFVNGLNLLDDEFTVSSNGETVTVTLANPINMRSVDVLEVVVMKCDAGASDNAE